MRNQKFKYIPAIILECGIVFLKGSIAITENHNRLSLWEKGDESWYLNTSWQILYWYRYIMESKGYLNGL